MAEYGFYHPSEGYRQYIGNKPVLSDDWVEIPLKPGADYEWSGKEWVKTPPDMGSLANEARTKRNALLTASDWTQVADAPVDQAAWATYRQELRDIPEQPDFPAKVVWPAKPT